MPEKKRAYLIFFLIVLLAGFFRVGRLDLMEYKADEALNVFLATRVRFGHELPPGGTISSVGILNPPLFTYFLTLASFITTNPLNLALTIAIMNSFSIGTFFLILDRYYSRSVAIFSSVLISFAPWPIIYSRKIWTQDLIFPFSILFFFSLHKALLEKKKEYLILLGCSLGILLQLHQTNSIILVIFAMFFIFSKQIASWKKVMAGFLLSLIPITPYLIFMLKTKCIGCAELLAKNHPINIDLLRHFFFPLQLLGTGGFMLLFGNDFTSFITQYFLIGKLRFVNILIYLGIITGGFIFWKQHPKLRIFPTLFLVLPVSFFFLRFDTFAHYYLSLFPIGFLFLGITISTLYQLRKPLVKLIALCVFALIISFYLIFDYSFFDYLNKHKMLPGDYGNTFAISNNIAQKQLRHLISDPFYDEIFIASFVPLQSVSGPDTIASQIYNTEETVNHLAKYEQRLSSVPEDYRIQLELTAFYTQNPVTRDTLFLLYRKSQKIPGYQPVFSRLLDIYSDQKNIRKQSISFPKN